MNETPRLRSAFPNTPRSDFRSRNSNGSPQPLFASSNSSSHRSSPITKPIRVPNDSRPRTTVSPLVPTNAVDAPTQRFYIFSFYTFLVAWKIYDWWHIETVEDSSWHFLKWMFLDATFFAVLPLLKIPWLEFSFATTMAIIVLHFFVDVFAMFRIPIPILAWLGGLFKLAYDREATLSDGRIRPADVLHNSSIILGKQIIHILPEGSAILNPEKQAFCLDSATFNIDLPIQINQTTPISIELARYDLETDEVETIIIGKQEAKQLLKSAHARSHSTAKNTPRTLHYTIKKTGLYQLQRVIDATNLDVRKRSFDVAVVRCPKASISSDSTHRCTGDLSKVSLQVEGVPPFKVRYSKSVNGRQFSSNVQNVQPSLDSGFQGQTEEDTTVLDPKAPHRGWTKATTESFEINEALHQNGSHSYTVEDIEDGLGNKVSYTSTSSKDSHGPRVESLMVHNRPQVKLHDCGPDRLIPIPKGRSTDLPVRVLPPARLHSSDWPLKLKYSFVPETDQAIPQVEDFAFDMTTERSSPKITRPGRYNLDSIDSQFCRGEVVEPSSCRLFNPPEPDVVLESEEIFDKCAGNPIGMLVNLDFTGTPPFKVRYNVEHRGKIRPEVREFPSMRGQIELSERSAGSYSYHFQEINDKVYGPVSLKDRQLTLRQDINPPASASFLGTQSHSKQCLGSPLSLQVRFVGRGPWDLDYEIIHAGKRKKHSAHSETEVLALDLPEQSDGGRYTVILTGVQDKTRCRTALKEERHFEVRSDRPTASFGDVTGKRTVLALEGKEVKIPLRLKGNAPWSVRIQNLDDPVIASAQHFRDANAVISVTKPGTYEIVAVDDQCQGVVDQKAHQFKVSWIPRPALGIKDVIGEQKGEEFHKSPICQGDESVLSLGLTGNAPFSLGYQQKFEPIKGSPSIRNKNANFVGSNAIINLDTAKPGEYTYTFRELADDRYSSDKQNFKPIVVKQQVYAPPAAAFAQPGKVYSYCRDDPALTEAGQETENIPLTLTGTPPFSIEIAIRHHGQSGRPEIVRQRDIQTNTYTWPISRASLALGTHSISIRSVKDGRGCEHIIDHDSSSVRIQVTSPPSITPLQSQENFCVGEYVSFSLSGQAPFEVYYTFQGRERKAKVSDTEFKRLAESPGEFIITGVSDSAMGRGKCRARKDIRKTIRPFPTVEIGRGKTLISDIHEGGEVDINFSFTGTPPFEFT